MTFIEYVDTKSGSTKFRQFYTSLNLKLPFDKFIKLPVLLTLGVINQYLVVRFGVFIYNLPDSIIICKVHITHESSREIQVIHDNIIVKSTKDNTSIIPTHDELIKAFSKIEVWLSDIPFISNTSELKW